MLKNYFQIKIAFTKNIFKNLYRLNSTALEKDLRRLKTLRTNINDNILARIAIKKGRIVLQVLA